MSGKRAQAFDDGDNDAKRMRSNNGSPAPAPNGSITLEEDSSQKAADRIAALKAKLAAAKNKAGAVVNHNGGDVPPPPPPPPSSSSSSSSAAQPANSAEEKRANALRKIEEIKAKAAAQRNQRQSLHESELRANLASAKARAAELAKSRSAAPSPGPQATQAQPATSDLQARLAEARARTEASRRQRENDELNAASRQDGSTARGGLGIGLHPSLIGNQETASAARAKAQGPKFSTTKGNQAQENQEQVNPYLAAEEETDTRQDDATYDPSISRKPSNRRSKPLAFVAQGKYIAQSIALQEQAELEAMKRRIALESKKSAMEQATDRSFLVQAPPEIEWWDESILQADRKTYDDWQHHNRIEAADSIITAYIQHPVLLAAPQDKFAPAPKPMMLTTKEMKKVRRQRRMADMKEEQAKIRLGLIEPPPPKVKKSNMMRVYGEAAVKDPTAVEARVNREIAERANNHEKANAERKLTKEQRAEKLKEQQAGDEAKGLRIAVFKVDNLSSGKHRYQVDINAKQHALSGIVILHPHMNLVIIEGGRHSVTAYKKLMLNRIKWSENTMPLADSGGSTFTAAAARNVNRDLAEGPSAIDTWLNPLTERGELKDLSENRCLLVWEGEERQKSFRKWGSRVCETDGEARDVLGRSNMQNMWDLAKGTTE